MGVLTVREPGVTKPRVLKWECGANNAQSVKEEFDRLMATNSFLAYAVEAPDKATVIREFEETAPEIKLTPRLVGG